MGLESDSYSSSRSHCLHLLSAEITDVHYHAWLQGFFCAREMAVERIRRFMERTFSSLRIRKIQSCSFAGEGQRGGGGCESPQWRMWLLNNALRFSRLANLSQEVVLNAHK
jgi:hypothetical protein